jgi:hypothetical protein
MLVAHVPVDILSLLTVVISLAAIYPTALRANKPICAQLVILVTVYPQIIPALSIAT